MADPSFSMASLIEVMEVLTAAFPEWGRDLGKAERQKTVALYVRRLQEYPVDIVREVALEMIDTAEFFPRIAKLRRAADVLVGKRRSARRRLEAPEGPPVAVARPVSPQQRAALQAWVGRAMPRPIPLEAAPDELAARRRLLAEQAQKLRKK
jgi:hypothetical protein